MNGPSDTAGIGILTRGGGQYATTQLAVLYQTCLCRRLRSQLGMNLLAQSIGSDSVGRALAIAQHVTLCVAKVVVLLSPRRMHHIYYTILLGLVFS